MKAPYHYIVLILVSVFFFSACSIQHKNEQGLRKQQITEVKKKFLNKIPENITTTRLNGTPWSLDQQKGKVLLLDFWATWCPHCVEAIPEISQIYERYKKNNDFLLVGVSLDEERPVLEKFLSTHNINWLQLYEDDMGWENSFARKFNIPQIPSLWLLDRSGKVVKIYFSSHCDTIEKDIATCLKDK